jgi:hypothetical protein
MVGQQWILPDPENRFDVLIYCGAKDKNGVDIADNDIINLDGTICQVVFDGGKLRWVLINHKKNDTTNYEVPFSREMASKSEVMSNVLQEK